MNICPCGSKLDYADCCKRVHDDHSMATTAEALMRARYSAFALNNTAFLMQSLWPSERKNMSEAALNTQASAMQWVGLTVHGHENGAENDTQGTVTFTANALVNGQLSAHNEKSLFKKKAGLWYFVKSL